MCNLILYNIYIIVQWWQRIYTVLVRERTAPPCVFQTFAHPTSPPACSVRQSVSWSILGEVGWANRGVLSVLLLIYILYILLCRGGIVYSKNMKARKNVLC